MRLGLKLATAAFAATLATAATSTAEATVYYVTTGQSNANTQLDINHTSSWTFTVGSNFSFDLGGGNFTIKRGPSTSLPIVLSLYSGSNASGTLLATKSVNPTAVTQSYAPVPFNFDTLVTLSGGLTGHQYFLALTSSTADAGNRQYFIKADSKTSLVFSDGGGGVIDPGGGGGTTPTPEPASALVLAFGLAGLGLLIRRKAGRAPALA